MNAVTALLTSRILAMTPAPPASPAPACDAGKNALCGVTPNFSIFGVEMDAKRIILFGVLWAVCLAAAVAAIMTNLTKLSWAKEHGRENQLVTAKSHLIWSFTGAGGLVGLPIIIGGWWLIFS